MNIDDLYLSTNSNKPEVFIVLYIYALPYESDFTKVKAVFSSMKSAEDYCNNNPLPRSVENSEYHQYFIENYDVEA